MMFDGYYVFQHSHEYYMFDILNMHCVFIDEQLYAALSHKDYSAISPVIRSYLKRLEDEGVFFYDTNSIEFKEKEQKKITFSLAPISECNLKCRYCFANSGGTYHGRKRKFDRTTARRVAMYIIDNFPYADYFRLDFVSGGEPLLNHDSLIDVITEIQSVFAFREKQLRIWLCTNGTLVDTEIIKWLDQHNVLMGISLDGPENVNDKVRIYKNGTGTYKSVLHGINIIKNDTALSNNLRYLWGLCVITSETPSLVEIIKHHQEIGFKNIQMKFVRLPKNHPLSINQDNLPDTLSKIDDLFRLRLYFFEK